MKVAALMALAGLGFSQECRELKFVTGDECPYGGSNTVFKIMPFNKEVPANCKVKGKECVVEVCGTDEQFEEDLVILGTGKVNSWNFNLYAADGMEKLSPETKCYNPTKKAFCCGTDMRLDTNVRRAEYTWPAVSSDSPTSTPSAKPTSAPSRAPTSTDSPSRSPSSSPTIEVTLSPTMGSKPCSQIKDENECKAAEFCSPRKIKKGRKTKFSCGDVMCKKFRKDFSACSKAPHCIAKMKKGKMKKCGDLKK